MNLPRHSSFIGTALLGLAIGWLAPPAPVSRLASTGPPGTEAGVEPYLSSADDRGAGTTAMPAGKAPATAYAKAWEALKRRHLPRAAREAIQAKLFSEWSLSDLESALRAALGETPGDVIKPDDPFFEEPPSALSFCRPGIEARPDLALEWIHRRTFGIETTRLGREWIEVVGKHDPFRLIANLDTIGIEDLPPDFRAAVEREQEPLKAR